MRRLVVPFFAAVLVAVTMIGVAPSPARAISPPLVVKDPTGDDLDGRASMDIVSVKYESKKAKKSDPVPTFTISVTLAAPPEERLATYVVKGSLPGCGGELMVRYTPGTVYTSGVVPGLGMYQLFICDEEAVKFLRGSVKGNTISFPMAVDSIPKAAREGGVIEGLHAFTTISEPAVGLYGNSDVGLPNDAADSDAEFTFV